MTYFSYEEGGYGDSQLTQDRMSTLKLDYDFDRTGVRLVHSHLQFPIGAELSKKRTYDFNRDEDATQRIVT